MAPTPLPHPSLTAMRRIFSRQKPQTKSPNDIPIDLDSLRCLFSEGVKLNQQSYWPEAAERFETCVVNYEKLLGPGHESTVASHRWLAAAYVEMNRLAEAESHLKTCEAAGDRNLGEFDIATLDVAYSLCRVLLRQRKVEEAKIKGEILLAALEKTEGPNGFSTLNAVLLLGEVCVHLGQYGSAVLYHQRALAGLESTLGIESTKTIDAQFKLGRVYGEMLLFNEAMTIYKQNQEVCEKTRGVTSESYLRATLSLGSIQRTAGYDLEAEKTLISMLPASKAQHFEKLTGAAVDLLIRLYKGSGRKDDALNIEKWATGEADVLPKVKGLNPQQQDTSGWSPRAGDDEEVCSISISHLGQAIILIITGIQLDY